MLRVETLGIEAVAKGVGVPRLCAAAWGGRVVLAGTNRERISGHRGKGPPMGSVEGIMEHLIQL